MLPPSKSRTAGPTRLLTALLLGALPARDLRVRGQRPVDLDPIPWLELPIGRSRLAEYADARADHLDAIEVWIRGRTPQCIRDRGRRLEGVVLG